MTPQRQGEIALKVLKYILRRHGIKLSQEMMRDFGNVAKAIEVPIEELRQFAKPLCQEVLDEYFGKDRVEIAWEDQSRRY